MTTTRQQVPMTRPVGRAALVALGSGAFVIGTAELVPVGILDLVGHSLAVSTATAGNMVLAYALGIALGGPLLTAATARMARRTLLVAVLVAFAAGNALAAAAPGMAILLLARCLCGLAHGVFVGVASVVAADLVPAERRGQAIAAVFGGIAVSTVVGVPLGTALGNTLGWRSAFAAIAVLTAGATLAVTRLVPRVAGQASGRAQGATRAALDRPVLLMLGLGFVLIGGQFTAFTYLAPFLTRVTQVSNAAVSVFLLVYGLAAAAGTFAGGRAADRDAGATLFAGAALVAGSLLVLRLTGGSIVAVVLALALWGFAAFSVIPALQLRVITLAGPGADLAATLGASAVNGGIAVGSLVGGAVLGGTVLGARGAAAPVMTALVVTVVALPGAWLCRRLTTRSSTPGSPRTDTDPALADPATATG